VWGKVLSIWPTQDSVSFLGFCARITTILLAPTLCVGTPTPRSSPTLLRNIMFPPDPPRYGNYIYQTILAMTISCKGQVSMSKPQFAFLIGKLSTGADVDHFIAKRRITIFCLIMLAQFISHLAAVNYNCRWVTSLHVSR